MYFSQAEFIYLFLPAFLIVYLFTGTAYRKYVLAAASLIFLTLGSLTGLFQALSLLAVNYVLLIFQRGKKRKGSVPLLCAAVILNAAFLFASRIAGITTFAGMAFMVCRLISLHADRYKKIVRKCPAPIEYLCFSAMFITVNAGPLVRYNEVEKGISHPRVNWRNIDRGLRLFTAGLALKVLLADKISFLWTEILSPGASALSVPIAWLGAFVACSQVYYDFWGYSLMAFGIGVMTGISVPENFHDPFASASVSEFYRRWHMTLGRWFKDYVYFPLGGSRKGMVRTVMNVMAVWCLTALWHGNSPNYLIWGLMLGTFICFEKLPFIKKISKNKIAGVILRILGLLVIAVSMSVFKNEDTDTMLSYLLGLFGMNPSEGIRTTGQQLLRYIKDYSYVLVSCLLFMTPLPRKIWDRYSGSVLFAVILLPIFWFSFHQIVLGNAGDFLYMRY